MRVGEDDIGWMDSLFPMYSPMGIGKGEEEGCYCRCRLAELRNLGLGLGPRTLVCWGVLIDGVVSVIGRRWDGVGLGLDDDL